MKKERNKALDFLKFLFVIMIMLFHGRNLAVDDTNIWFVGGAIGVDFFFVVSGCMMAMSSARREPEDSLGMDTFHFLRHKILGLCPNFFVAYVIGFFVSQYPEFSLPKMSARFMNGFWEMLFLNQSGLTGYRVNHVTWYLSAMLLAMLLIYPLLRRFGKTFYYWICPTLFILLMGFTYQNFKSLFNPTFWNGWMMKGLMRGIIGILGGCISYQIMLWLKNREFTIFGKICLTLAEWGSYIGIANYYFQQDGTKYDWSMVFLFVIAVGITVSQCSLDPVIFRTGLFAWLGEYSFSLFLGHGYWSHVLPGILPQSMSYEKRMGIYIVISMLTGLLIMYLSKALQYFWKKNGTRVKHLFVK